jgi:RNA polymerase sigma-70 factor, ECF subfamily
MPESSENFSEKELIAKAQAGQQYFFELLVRSYLPAVYGLSFRYLKDKPTAEDATQEVFVKMWRHLSKFDQDKSFRAWILTITKNTCLDLLKKKSPIAFSRLRQSEEEDNYLADTLESHDLSPEESAERVFAEKSFNNLLDKLSVSHRRVLSLYYDKGLNFREIAEELSEPIDTIKSRHRRGVHKLRELLKP